MVKAGSESRSSSKLTKQNALGLVVNQHGFRKSFYGYFSSIMHRFVHH